MDRKREMWTKIEKRENDIHGKKRRMEGKRKRWTEMDRKKQM